ncbi:MAG: phage virion morphogenesis protein [Candidatus Pacearchaeota archaeon]
MEKITITISGIDETVKAFNSISKDLENAFEPLDMSSRKYMNYISSNFTDEGETFGKPWPRLSPATIAIKKALKKEGRSIGVEKPLLRTGALRKSFGFDIAENIAMIYNNMDYAIVHQEGGTVEFRGKVRIVPKRILADVDDKRVEMVASIFEAWVQRIINKYDAGK